MTTMNTTITAGRLVALSLALASPAAAQRADGLPWTAGAGVRMESYAFADADRVGIDQVRLVTVPLVTETRVAGRVRVGIAGAWASAALRHPDGTESTLSGLTDTELRLSLPLAGDRVMVTGFAVLPTGKERLSEEEMQVGSVIASDLLPFSISHWGSGGGFGGSVALARRLGPVGVGASGGFRASREYQAFEGEGAAYRPGNEAFLRLAVDRSFGAGKATLLVSAHRYAHDRLDGGNLYRAGDRWQLIGSYSFAGGRRASGVVYAGVLHRENGSSLAELAGDVPSQALYLAGAGARVTVGRGALLPSVDARVFRAADGVGQGYGVGVGASAEVPAGAVVLVPSARLRLGNVLVRDDSRSAFTGMELGFTLRRERR
jgi:hypothetical protein